MKKKKKTLFSTNWIQINLSLICSNHTLFVCLLDSIKSPVYKWSRQKKNLIELLTDDATVKMFRIRAVIKVNEFIENLSGMENFARVGSCKELDLKRKSLFRRFIFNIFGKL